jgi:hypothetical protein
LGAKMLARVLRVVVPTGAKAGNLLAILVCRVT